jgi:DNA polymerase I
MKSIKNKKLINAWARADKKSVGVCYENKYGERKTVNVKVDWYFVIKEEDYKKAAKVKKAYDFDIRSDYLEPERMPGWVKIYVDEIKDEVETHRQGKYVPKQTRLGVVARFDENGIKTYEGDMDVLQRWYVDTKMEVADADRFNKLYFDIETQDELGKIEIGAERIISFAGVDNRGKQCFFYLKELTDEAEIELLDKILDAVARYDIILGWNSREFDVPYLKARMRKFGMHQTHRKKYAIWYRIAEYDLLQRFRHQFRFDSNLRSFSLNYISNHFLGRGKVSYDQRRIIDLWHEDKKLLKEYNFEDSVLVKDLDEKLGVSDMMILQSSWCHVPPAKFGLYKIIDAYILDIAHQSGLYEPTSMFAVREKQKKLGSRVIKENPNETDTEKNKYYGGLVLDPTVGLHRKVYTLDFKSLYPSIMKTCNVGHETLRYENEGDVIINPGTQVLERRSGGIRPTYFIKEKSTINKAISEVLLKRKEYKALKLKMIEEGTNKGPDWDLAVSNEIVVKEVANSMYGIMGMEYGRYFAVDVAESITLFGQWIIANTKKYFEEHRNYECIYGDTDSVFLSTGKEIDLEKELEMYHDWLTQEFKEKYNIDEHFIVLEPDKEFDGLILVAKKTYCGRVVELEGKKTDAIYSRGVEFNKRGTFGYGARKQKELVEFILHDAPGKSNIKKWLLDAYDEYLHTEFSPEELSISHKVGKNVEDYVDEKVSTKVVKKKDKVFREEMYSYHMDMEDEEIIVRKKQTLPLHVRIAKKIKEETGEFYKNTEVEYIVTSNEKRIDGVHTPDFKGEWSRDYYWNNKTLPLLTRITHATHPEVDVDELFKTEEDD